MTKKYPLIGLSAAISNNGWMGMQNKLPWEFVGKRLPEELSMFRVRTIGHGNNAIVYGRNTLVSFGNKALPDRVNNVLSRDETYIPPACVTRYKSYDEAIDALREEDVDEIWICGGKSVYEQALAKGRNRATVMTLTKTYDDYEGDVAFPKYDTAEWSVYNTAAFPKFGYNVNTLHLIE